MFEIILLVVVGIISAVFVGYVSRRVLGVPVGWPRSIVVGVLVFVCGLPFSIWVLRETGAMTDSKAVASDSVIITLILLSIAWVFALGVGLLVILEAVFPTSTLRNPVDVVRAGLKRQRRTRRYLQILEIASRNGAGWLVRGRNRADAELTTSEQRAAAVVKTINQSGVTFVKLGQVLSTRRDLVPEPYLSALASLQSGASTIAWPAVRKVIEDELGRPISDVFQSIEEEPLAAASVAQVHRGTLLDGTRVVVKVQRPEARAQVEADVDIILRLAKTAETHTQQGRDLRAESVAKGFTQTLLDELDYRIEYSNTEMIRATLVEIAAHADAADITIDVPKVYRQASTRRMITMDLVDGQPLSRASAALAELTPEARHALAVGLMNAVLEQILVCGVFHADLHPGNVILREDASLGLIDFGAVGIIEKSQRENLAGLLLAASSEDDISATDALMLIVDVPEGADIDSFRHDIGLVLTTVRFRRGGDGSIFSLMLDVIRQHHIALPATLSSAFRSFATLEGCLHVIVPDFDLVTEAFPRVPTIMRRMLDPKRLAIGVQAQLAVGRALLRKFPRRIDSLMEKLDAGTFGIRIRSFSEGDDREWINSIVSEFVGVFVSVSAVVIAIILVINGVGPLIAPNLHLFDLLGAVVGFFGFLGILRTVLRTFFRRSR
ncbi:ABC1 kinase family protein [Subtercola sp. YIM 133946]|uniref:ABC1 kinase family protein n=1 Tax=Subtercola sp. YIM 133946 TaxID=3118909 RepID=UPI002F92728A